MQRFWWPGYEMQLLEQLQTQQNRAQFCDTLLQTEGIAIPTHSCVLAALSPYLSERLSDSPSPPLGQKRLLHLQEVTAHTLLKLVGLLYSGRLEVKSSKEQNDVLAAAHKFGISDLVLGCRDGERKGVELLERGRRFHTGEGTEPRKGMEMQDAQVESDISGKTENDSLVQRKSFLTVGTQTVNNTLMSVASPGPLSDQTPPPTIETAFSVSNSSASLLPQNLSKFSLTSYLTVHSEPESTAGQSSDCLTHSSSFSASSRYRGTVLPVANDDVASPTSHEKNISKQLVERERSGQEDGNLTVDGGSCAQPRGVCRETIRGEEKEKSNSNFRRSGKNLDRMKEVEQMMDSAQISVKMKLRRRTKGEEWEIVEDADETASVPTNPNQSCSNQKTPQFAPKVVNSPAHSVHPVQKPEALKVQLVLTSSPQPPKHANTSSDSEARSSGWLSLSRSSELESEGRTPLQGPTEESDEKIDKLLENIIMSMSMLPDLGRSCRKTHVNHDDVPTYCQVPGAESGATAPLSDVCTEECVFCQDLGRQGSHSDTDTGLHYCFGAQNQSGYTNPSAAHTALQTDQPHHSEFRSFVPMDGLSWTGGESSPYPVSCFSNGQKLHDLILQQPFCQEDQSIEFLSLSHESDSQSADAFSLPTMEDLRLPQCLSPLVPSAGHQQPDPSVSGRMEKDVQSLPWLTKNACMLTFPLNAITAGKTELLEADSNTQQSQSFRKLTLKNEGPGGPAKGVGQREIKPKRERKTDAMKRKKNKHDAAEDTAPPKRKRRRRPDSWRELAKVSSLDPEVVNAATTVCSVSLSCNNVLMKQREIGISSLNKPPSASTATGNGKSREPGTLCTKQPRIKTRGFVKQSERDTSNAVSDKCCVLIPMIRRPVVVHKQDPAVTKRRRGRPPKVKLENFPEDAGAIVENKGHVEAGEEILEKESPMEDIKFGKLMSSAGEGEAKQLKKTTSDESSGINKTDNMKSGGPQKQSWMVTLKEFQKLIKRKHSKTRKGTEVQGRNKPADVGESEKQAQIDKSGTSETHSQALFDATVDENHNQLPNTSAAACKTSLQDVMINSEARKSCGSGEEDKPACSCDVLEEEKQSATNLDEGADGGSTLSGCNEKEEDEEVDVILYSPDKFSTRELEERVVVIPDEEEEDEDVIEIDVIGDEEE
ncbi:BTB/POZ domain-containing protein 18 [Xiphophorus maculatus]|uniref:BTB domain containing 18 n=1 Tax=Xiphophorus maculatus TaxID=8083 RepID=A0A3B5R9Y5_XIPMA|nr:BTB/POZ domain-containing protein 18 [Xiphophorus maculatus]